MRAGRSFLAVALVACASSSGSLTHPDAGTSPRGSTGEDAGSSQGAPSRTGTPKGQLDAAAVAHDGALATFGSPFTGGFYNLGPVDYAETEWHNACAPATKYPVAVQAVEGSLLAGLWGDIPNVAGYCDTCIQVTTGKGKSAVLRVVTYGDTTPNSLDTSQSAYDQLSSGEYPREMTWELVECPDTGPILYEFQTASSEWWTSLWVRNARVPLASVEVESPNHPTWAPLTRGSDGSLTDASGFGQGSFTIRSTGVDGQVVTETFSWPSAGIGGAFLTGAGNFK
jgi:expansin (peptidoglycan-binding protein)